MVKFFCGNCDIMMGFACKYCRLPLLGDQDVVYTGGVVVERGRVEPCVRVAFVSVKCGGGA